MKLNIDTLFAYMDIIRCAHDARAIHVHAQ